MTRPLALLALLLAGSTATASAAEPCRPIPGLEPWVRPGSVLLLGEIHGTVESPAFAGDVVCHVAETRLPVVLALELPAEGQGRVDAFVAAGGGEQARRALLAGPVWQRQYQDGRASLAMLELIERVARLRQSGAPARVALFDPGTAGGGQARDRGMAARLAELVAAEAGAVTVVLTGNLHSRTRRGIPGNADYEPMGYLLARHGSARRLGALREAHGGGTAWVCSPECGVVELRGRSTDRPWKVETGDGPPPGHDGWYRLGRVTASPPARFSADEWAAIRPEPRPEAVSSPPPKVPEEATDAARPKAPLSAAESSLQGRWQGYDAQRGHRTWTLDVEGRGFRAEGSGEWYEGHLVVGGDQQPAAIDFVIERCRCAYLGSTSKAVFGRDGESLMIAAVAPGNPRPTALEAGGAQLMRFAPR